jgi:hypothetical protein
VTARAVRLADVVADPLRAADVEPDQAPAMLAQLAAASSAIAARLLMRPTPEPTPASDVDTRPMLTADGAGRYLGMSKDWVYRRWPELGGVKVGPGALRFPVAALDDFIARKRAETDSPTAA